MTRQYVKQTTSDGGSTSYYTFPMTSRDIGDLIDFKEMNYNIGNIFKACYRLGEKQGISKAYDLKKIMFFATRELEKIEGSKEPSCDLPSDVSCDELHWLDYYGR